MRAIKKAIYNRLVTDPVIAGLIAKDAEGKPLIFQARPDDTARYPQITFLCITSDEDEANPLLDEDYQFDIWSDDPDVNDQIAERIRDIFHKQPLPAAGRRIDAFLRRPGGEQELYEDDERVHHKVLTYNCISFPA